jgi:nitroreductase
MLLAARALSLGAILTTLYLIHEKEAEAAMRIPDSHHSYAIIPVGYPVGRFGLSDANPSPMLFTMTFGDGLGLAHSGHVQ